MMNGKRTAEYMRIENFMSILKMSLIFGSIFIFIIFLAPEVDKIKFVEPVVMKIDEQGIDASALFYTDIDEFSAAELNITTSLKYSPIKFKNMLENQ